MKEHLFYLIAMVISGGILMNLSIHFNWSQRLWCIVNKQFSNRYNLVMWLFCTVILQVLIQVIVEHIGFNLELTKMVLGMNMGLSMAFIPNLGAKE